MTRVSAARRGFGANSAAFAAWLLAALLAAPSAVRAQQQPTAVLAAGEGPSAGRLRAHVQAALAGETISDPTAWVEGVRGVELDRLELLARIEALLARARAQTAALNEAEALSTLAEASRLAEGLGDVPGASLWNAEVELAIGVTAAQAGLTGLAEQAFRRAAALDPERRLLGAEAPPATVALHERVRRELALSANGEFEVRVEPPGARVFLDDVPRGTAPLRVRAPVGRHVLRVEAPGYRPYGAVLDVLGGQRAALQVALAEDPAASAARALERAAAGGDYAGVVSAVRALERAGLALDAVFAIEAGPAEDRALLVRCDASGCAGPVRLAGAAVPRPALDPRLPLDPPRLAAGRAWLNESAVNRPAAESPAWWRSWYVWSGLVALAGAAAGLALALQPEAPPPRLRVILEPE